jgi:formylglycine-generating enzyme required for sulfatase activity
MRNILAICLFVFGALMGHVQAGMYFWTDDQGVRHFSDTPVPGLPQEDVKKQGKIWSNSYGMQFVYLEPGTFIMGLQASKGNYDPFTPAHKVTLTRGFQIQVTEVTHEQWKKVMPKTASPKKKRDRPPIPDNMPVCGVSPTTAQYFVAQLNKLQDGGRYQIPTEAQWEYACRAGQTSEFNWGSDIAYPNQANFKHTVNAKRSALKPVASYAPNGWQLYDMHGNVWEWCQEVSYKSTVDPNPILQTLYESSSPGYDPHAIRIPLRTEPSLILRGGDFKSPAYKCRSGYRYHLYGTCYCGLRVIRVPED